MINKQIRSMIMLILIVTLVVPFFIVPAHAAYENTYTNTGNMRNDIIGVALTQVGYEEGSNNYTKYGVWYGQSNAPWCGMFVSWCAKEAGVPTSVLKRTGIANPSNFGLSYQSGSDYTPQKGDLFFKKSFSHVGFVYYTEGSYFYTIEGNTSTSGYDGTSVMIRKRKISDYYFSSPNYSGSGSSVNYSCDHEYTTKVEADHPHKEFEICTKCNQKKYTGNEITNETCKTCIQESCSHSFGDWKSNSDSKHKRTCTKCELEEVKAHEWENGKITKEATCVDEGSQQVICTVCSAETVKTIKATELHDYGDFAYIDETTHQKVCSMCDEQIAAHHVLSENWQNDGIYHWTSCKECNGQICRQEHNFSAGCLTPCDTCGYTLSGGHKSNGAKANDNTHHWDVCSRCEQKFDTTAHIYTSDCDEICNTCGYKRTAAIAHQDRFHANDTGHWRRCDSCTRVTDIVSHSPDQNVEEWETQTCVHCNYVLRSSENHNHAYYEIEYNNTIHWGSCICGENMGSEVHNWNFSSGTCSICGIQSAQNNGDTSENFLIMLWNLIFKKV